MKNSYEVRGNITAIFIESKKYGQFETLISTEKLQLVSEAVDHWFITFNKTTRNFYVNGNRKTAKSSGSISLHRLIMGMPQGKCVDHINHNTLDNRDENLRTITNQQNQQNRKGPQVNSSSGVRGVYWHKASKKWCAQVKVRKKKIDIGYYCEIEEAEKSVILARQRLMPYAVE